MQRKQVLLACYTFYSYICMQKQSSRMDVLELFAGVGGFRVGLERVNTEANDDFFHTIWSNQFEPSTKRQHAFEVYNRRFPDSVNVNRDIALVPTSDIPDAEMLCGGFPCQDYSVARTLGQSSGIYGKKGVLWWQIERICREKGDDAPSILFLENVDRLLISPANQRGRDFAMILQSLADLDYAVEWRVINAADYGMPQRRRRTYILAYKAGSPIARSIGDCEGWLRQDGVFAHAFPVAPNDGVDAPINPFKIKENGKDSLVTVSDGFNKANIGRPFSNAGVMQNGIVWTTRVEPLYHGMAMVLRDVLARGDERGQITEDFYIHDDALPQWRYLKGAKHEPRTAANGHHFVYSEGAMSFPDDLDKPSRTIITSEGGSSPSRFKHVIQDPVDGRLRRLIPLELERLDMFPDNHTAGQTDQKRAFFMGNALVCGIVTKVGEEIYRRLGQQEA